MEFDLEGCINPTVEACSGMNEPDVLQRIVSVIGETPCRIVDNTATDESITADGVSCGSELNVASDTFFPRVEPVLLQVYDSMAGNATIEANTTPAGNPCGFALHSKSPEGMTLHF